MRGVTGSVGSMISAASISEQFLDLCGRRWKHILQVQKEQKRGGPFEGTFSDQVTATGSLNLRAPPGHRQWQRYSETSQWAERCFRSGR